MRNLNEQVNWILRDVERYCALAGGLSLRSYQKPVARAVVDSVLNGKGYLFLIVFPRQSGKNEVQAHIEAYLLTLLSDWRAQIIKISPTLHPQAVNAMTRLETVMENNLITRGLWKKESGNRYRIGKARITFLSGAPQSNIVGATASTLLQVDEAQSIEIAKYDKEIAPMAASANATRVLWGTAWTSQTLLARELRAARQAEQADGVQRVFFADADSVAREVPQYRLFVAEQIARHGRANPFIKSQFFSEEIDAQGGLFPTRRQALIQGSHPAHSAPQPGAIYAMLLDLAGEDEGLSAAGELQNPARDATALTIVAVDLSTLKDPFIERPSYHAVHRRLWVGIKHASLYAELRAVAERWRVRWIVVDATGVGAGLSSFLTAAFPFRVIPFIFTQSSKSQLGWDFTALLDTGRWKEFVPASASPEQAALQSAFFEQLTYCQFEILPGPSRTIRWGVPDGARQPISGEVLHDDLLFSASLSTQLDEQDWKVAGQPALVRRPDPLKELDHVF